MVARKSFKLSAAGSTPLGVASEIYMTKNKPIGKALVPGTIPYLGLQFDIDTYVTKNLVLVVERSGGGVSNHTLQRHAFMNVMRTTLENK